MAAYRNHQMRLPETMGRIVPEAIASPAEYRSQILEPMYRAVAALDGAEALCHEWLNARGAIPRFDRNAIEIRVIDVQECPQADIAIAAIVVAVLKGLYEQRHGSLAAQLEPGTDALATILDQCISRADAAEVSDTHYLGLLGWHGGACSAGRLWRHLIETADPGPAWQAPLQTILEHGPLARRILKAAGDCAPLRLHQVYTALCDCLAEGRSFRP
jgi:carboxylate-amine ligase